MYGAETGRRLNPYGEGTVVTNFQYSAHHFHAVSEVEGNCELCLHSFVLEEDGGGWKKGEGGHRGEIVGEILEPIRPEEGCFLH